MSIQDEINRIGQNVANTYSVLNEMGATMPSEQNSNNLPNTARTIPQSGGSIQEVFYFGFEVDSELGAVIDCSFEDFYNEVSITDIDMITPKKLINFCGMPLIYADEKKDEHEKVLYVDLIVTVASDIMTVRVHSNRVVEVLYTGELELIDNRVAELSADSTDEQYPSAKAVYDFVQANIGGGGSAVTEIFYVPFKVGASGFELDGITYSDIMSQWQAGKRIMGKVYIPEQAGLGFAGNFELDMTYLTPDASFVLGFITGPMSVEVFIKTDDTLTVNIKQLQEAGQGGSGESVQSDYLENDSAKASYIKNRPFYDNSISSRFVFDNEPNPVTFDTVIGYTFLKVSDLTFEVDKLTSTNFVFNQGPTTISLTPTVENIIFQSTDGVILYFTSDDWGQFCYYIAYNTGTIVVDFMGMQVPIEVPELGIYVAGNYFSGASVTITYRDVKKIDEKFLPSIGGGTIIDLHLSDDGITDSIPLDQETAELIYNIAVEGKVATLRLKGIGTDGSIIGEHFLLSHIGLGQFSIILVLGNIAVALWLSYNHATLSLDTQITSMNSTSGTSTYGLRQPALPTTLAELFEMLRESAIERGIIL